MKDSWLKDTLRVSVTSEGNLARGARDCTDLGMPLNRSLCNHHWPPPPSGNSLECAQFLLSYCCSESSNGGSFRCVHSHIQHLAEQLRAYASSPMAPQVDFIHEDSLNESCEKILFILVSCT